MKLLIATSNPGKFSEIAEFLGDIPNLSLLSLADMNYSFEDPEETGASFEENARIKAEYYFTITGIPTLAEDSGIEIEALSGELGIKTRRWGAGEKATDEQWMQFFLARMEHESNRNARFFCAACLMLSPSQIHIFEGSAEGVVLQHSDVPLQKGVPLSSYFLADGSDVVFAALSKNEKNIISHRGKAMKKLGEKLKHIINYEL